MNLPANWKTTVSGIGAALFSALTLLAALPYQFGDISAVFPPEWKGKIVTASAIAAFALKVWNSVAQKDRNVTGGNVQQTLSGNVAPDGAQTLVDATLKATPTDEAVKSGVPIQIVTEVKKQT